MSKELREAIRDFKVALAKALLEDSSADEKERQIKMLELLEMYECGSKEYNYLLDVWEVLFNENENR